MNVKGQINIMLILIIAAMLVVAGVAGFVVGKLLSGDGKAQQVSASQSQEEGNNGETASSVSKEKYAFLPFDPVVVNTAEGRMTRYLTVKIVLQVDKKDAAEIQKIVEGDQKVVFKDWLISYLSDMRLEDVKGRSAINRLRREIRDGFNAILAKSTTKRIRAVLFESFNVQ